MNSSTILASLLIIISQASFAKQPENDKRPDMAALTSQLRLDEGKTQQLKEIIQSHHEKMKQLHQNKQQDRNDRHALRNQHREQLLTILDHQQLYQLESYMQQFRPQRKSQNKSNQINFKNNLGDDYC